MGILGQSRKIFIFYLDIVSIIWYTANMKTNYRHKKTSVSMINYHIIFCPRYRRKIFLIEGLETRFKELVVQICEQNDYVLIALECDRDHCHIFVNVPPDVSAADVVRVVKANTAKALLQEFKEFATTRNLWTRSYFASTAGDVSTATIKKYVEAQKKRG